MDTPSYEPSRQKSPPRKRNRSRRWILPGALVALALSVFFALRELSPWLLERTTLTVERSLTEALGNPVRFQAIVPRFRGLRPEVELRGFAVVGPLPDSPLLMQARSVRIRLDLLESLRLRQARFGRILIEGLRAGAFLSPEGRWEVRGVRAGTSAGPSALAVPAWLSPALTLELVDARLEISAAKETRDFNLARGEFQGGWAGQVYGSAKLEGLAWSWPSLYKETQRWKSLSLGWKYAPGVTDSPRSSVKLEEIRLEGREIAVSGRTAVAWADGSEPDLDIGLEAGPGSFAAVRALIPEGAIPSSVQAWLSRSIKTAQIESTRFALQGKPSKPRKLSLQVGFKDLALDYLPGWPLLKSARGQLQLENGALSFRVAQAEASGISLSQAQGEIADLKADNPVLVVGSEATAEEKPFAAFLKEGPLREQLAPLWEHVEWSGPAQVGWRWSVPLGQEGSPAGTLDLRSGALRIKHGGGIEAARLEGRIEVSATEAKAAELKAEVLGEPARFGFAHPLSGRGIRATRISAEVPVTAEQVAAEFPAVKPWLAWNGRLRAALAFELQLPPARARSEVKLGFKASSDLEGLALTEPSLIAKDAASRRWLALEGEVSGSRLTRIEGLWAESRESQNPSIRWEYEPVGSGSLTIDARLRRLDWDPWEDKLKARKKPAGESQGPGSFTLNVQLDELAARSNVFHGVRLGFEKEGPRWTARLKSDEANGELNASFPLNRSVLEAKFSALKLAHWPARGGEGESPESASDSAKAYAEWPGLALSVENMELGRERLGAVKLKATQTGERLKIDECSVKNPEYEMACEGGKLVYSGDAPATSFSGSVKIKDLDHRLPLESIGALEAPPGGKIRFDFTWPGTPDRFEWAFLKGSLNGDVDRGRLKEVRLASSWQINFSNLRKGDGTLPFRKLAFRLNFDRGTLQIQPAKLFFGSTFVKIQGRVGLVSKQIDITRSVRGNLLTALGNAKHALGLESDEEHEETLERELYSREPTEGLDVKRMKGTWEKPVEEE